MKRFQMESENDMAIAKRVMELTRTWDFAQRPVNELSGGERQRVIIAESPRLRNRKYFCWMNP